MPEINLIPVPLYQPLDPYIHTVDNLPIQGLIERIFAVNDQVDINTLNLSGAAGTQGTFANRLNQSINDDGTLKTTSINNALHSIEDHLDTVNYVRMLTSERSKLAGITSGATSLKLNVQVMSNTISFDNETVEFAPSDSISWAWDGVRVTANTLFPSTVRHTHTYGIIPTHQNMFTPDYINYKTTTTNQVYQEGSLRVYLNGVRLTQYQATNVPISYSPLTFQSFYFTEDAATGGTVTSGKFSLSSAINSSINIVIDFDVLY